MDSSGKKILIIDDDEMILKSLVSLFEMENFTVISASDGKEGLEKVKTETPDAIITDIEMEKVDGINVLHEIRSSGEWGKAVPVVLFTNFDGDGEVIDSIHRDHPSLFLKKSEVTAPEILAQVKELLQ